MSASLFCCYVVTFGYGALLCLAFGSKSEDRLVFIISTVLYAHLDGVVVVVERTD